MRIGARSPRGYAHRPTPPVRAHRWHRKPMQCGKHRGIATASSVRWPPRPQRVNPTRSRNHRWKRNSSSHHPTPATPAPTRCAERRSSHRSRHQPKSARRTTMPSTTPEQYAAAEADAARHRAKLDAIKDAENAERQRVQLEHFTDAAGPRATRYRDERDEAKAKLDTLAGAETVDVNELFTAFFDFKTLDARAGALRNHAHRINTIAPLGRNHAGADQSHVIHCDSLYDQLTWGQYLEQVVTERTRRSGSQHGAELESEASQKVT